MAENQDNLKYALKVNAALWTIYTMPSVITEILGYKMNSHKEQFPGWIRRESSRQHGGKLANF